MVCVCLSVWVCLVVPVNQSMSVQGVEGDAWLIIQIMADL